MKGFLLLGLDAIVISAYAGDVLFLHNSYSFEHVLRILYRLWSYHRHCSQFAKEFRFAVGDTLSVEVLFVDRVKVIGITFEPIGRITTSVE